MKITYASSEDRFLWDEYVSRHETSHFFQFYGWREIFTETYGCGSLYLMAKVGKEIVGILPLFIVGSSIFGGKYISSMPGGVCADTEDVVRVLIDTAVENTREKDAKYLKIRDSYSKCDFSGGQLEEQIEYSDSHRHDEH